MLVNIAGNAYGSWFGENFHARGHVDAVAIEIVALNDYIAQADADAHHDPLFLRQFGIAPRQRALNLDRALDRVDGAAELGQRAVPVVLKMRPSNCFVLGSNTSDRNDLSRARVPVSSCSIRRE